MKYEPADWHKYTKKQQKDDAPWLELAGLSQKEIEDLRKSKKELTQYAKQKLRKMNNNYIPDDDVIEEMLQVKLTEEKKEELNRIRKEQEKDTDK
jgi:hypothetical protein